MTATRRVMLLCAFLVATGVYLDGRTFSAPALSQPLRTIETHKDGWSMVREVRFSERIMSVLRAADYLSRIYADPEGRAVDLYVGFHSGTKDSGPIHSPRHCLPGSGWHELEAVPGKLSVGETEINLVRAIYQKGEQKQVFLYWYRTMNKTTGNEYLLKALELLNGIVNSRKDATFIRVGVHARGNVEEAFEIAEKFVASFYGPIEDILP